MENNYLQEISDFVFTSKYARYNELLGRRETWEECIDRVLTMHLNKFKKKLNKEDLKKIKWAFDLVKQKRVVPSMRSLQFGGQAIEAHESRTFNCSVTHVHSIRSFAEAFYLLLCGCFPKDTPILTSDGIKLIKDVKVGDLVYSLNTTTKQYELKPVLDILHNEIAKEDNIKIVSRFGNFITSKNHPVYCYKNGEWNFIPAEKLKVGDIINKFYINKNEGLCFNKEAYFVGSFLGDGCSNLIHNGSRRIRMLGDNESVINKFAELMNELSGEKTLVTKSNSKRYSSDVWETQKTLNKNNYLTKNWSNLVGELPNKKTFVIDIPNWIKNSLDRNAFFSFLAGLIDTDGFISESKIFISTSSKLLVDSLVRYCPLFGVYPWVNTIEVDSYTSKGYTPTKPMYRVGFSITEFFDYSNFFFHNIKRDKIINYKHSTLSQHKTLVIPINKINEEIQYLGIDKDVTKYSFTYQVEDHGTCRSGYYYSRNKSYDHLMQYDQIIEIVKENELEDNVFIDLTIADNHNYLVGDGSFYTVHNCGVGFGLSSKFLDRLPDLVNAKSKTGTVITYGVEDNIEGWSDSIEALLNCYFQNTAYTGRKIVFDYSRIRPEGAPLKTGGGKAPGYKGLKNCHQKIKNLLDHIIEDLGQTRLKTVNAYDILMHIADAVLSGGIRRSACSVLFDFEDEDMMNAKTFFTVSKHSKFSYDEDTKKHYGKVKVGKKTYDVEIKDSSFEYEYKQLTEEKKISWIHIEPQRARSNNSVLLLRDECTEEQFKNIFEKTKQFGEPGFAFVDSKDVLLNPSLRGDTKILTEHGIFNIKELENASFKVKNLYGQWEPAICRLSGIDKELWKIKLVGGKTYFCTEEHKWPVFKTPKTLVKKETKDLKPGDLLPINTTDNLFQGTLGDYDDGFIVGWLYGDGWITTRKDNGKLQFGFIVSNTDEKANLLEYITSILETKTGAEINWSNRKNCHEVNIQRASATEYFLKFGIKLDKKSLPDAIWNGGSEEFRKGFIDGILSSDGSINTSCDSQNTAILLTSSRETLIDEIIELFGFYGITTTKHEYTIDGNKRAFPNGKTYDKIYHSYILRISTIESIKHFVNIFKISHSKKWNKLKDFKFLPEIIKHQRPVKIESVEKTNIKENVWDISVYDSTHCFTLSHCVTGNCFEISFEPVDSQGVPGVQFCNLTSINGAKTTSLELFLESVEAATIIGTLQASYTNKLNYLTNVAKRLTDEEALLGVSITGMMDNPNILLNPEYQKTASSRAKEVNLEWANKIGINPAARITCVKPEGSSSLVLQSASGIHPHHARRYLRRVQCNKIDPVYLHFKSINPHMCEESVWSANKTDDIVSFPIEVSPNAILKEDLNAIQHLEMIKSTQLNWVQNGTTEFNKKNIHHNVSCTVIVKDDEWDTVLKYLYDNRYYFCAVSLLPFIGDKLYKQAPLESVQTEEDIERWNNIINSYKKVDYKLMKEGQDNTKLQETAVCAGGQCELF